MEDAQVIARQDPVVPRANMKVLLPSLLVSNVALFMVYLALASVFLPTQVAAIDPDPVRKALNLSIVTGSAAIVAALAQPIFGLLSDRSRRRNPWILWSGIATAVGLYLMAGVKSVLMLAIAWCIVGALANAFQATLTAVIPDRVPLDRRGAASAVVGLGTPIASIVGITLASAYIDRLQLGYLIFGVVLAVSGLLFVLLNKETPIPRTEGVSIRHQWATLVSSLGHRDFRLAFLSRAAMMFAYFVVFGYLLYMLQARVQLPEGMTFAGAMPVISAVSALAMVVGTLGGGLLADKLQRYRLFVMLSAVLMVIACIAPLVSSSFGAMLAWAALGGLGFGCFMSVDTAIVTLVLPSAEDAARDMGILNIANAAPQTLASFVAGLLVAAFGGGGPAYAALFVASIIFAVLGGLAIRGIRGVR